MNIEISPEIEYADELVVSVMGDAAAIGFKRFRRITEFRYDWLLHDLSRDDVIALVETLRFAAEHMETR